MLSSLGIAPNDLALRIAALGHNQSSFCRLLVALGDSRSEEQIRRNMTNYLNGSSKVPGELIVVLNLLFRYPAAAKAVKPRPMGRPPGKKQIAVVP